MMKRISAFALAGFLLLVFSMNTFACNEEQIEYYVLQVMFGKENASNYKSNKNVQKLLNALYICSEQSNKDGQDKLSFLKRSKISNVPSLEQINISGDQLFECSHKQWKYENTNIKKKQNARRKILRQAVINVFDFGWFDETFRSNYGKIDSFSALLYYIHILADYLADDPVDTEFSSNGYDISAYSGESEIKLQGNIPNFTDQQKKETGSYKEYSDLDSYGRCGVAISNIGTDLLAPPNSRDNNTVHRTSPTGWQEGNKKYSDILPGDLYNRCHLIAHQLGGVDTRCNLITGTDYLNDNMAIYEKMVIDHVRNTGNHVLYRVTPVYVGDNQVASGVQLEGYSIEDNGTLSFNVYLYNVQPGVDINYANGYSEQADNLYGMDNVLPFATTNPSDENPDLMYEIEKQLVILFSDQKNYENETCKLQDISNNTRTKISDCSNPKDYLKMKDYQYAYIEELSSCVSTLLKKEDFFMDVF